MVLFPTFIPTAEAGLYPTGVSQAAIEQVVTPDSGSANDTFTSSAIFPAFIPTATTGLFPTGLISVSTVGAQPLDPIEIFIVGDTVRYGVIKLPDIYQSQGDNARLLGAQLKPYLSPVDLSDAVSVTARVRDLTTEELTTVNCTITDATEGQITYQFPTGFEDRAGDFRVQFIVNYSDSGAVDTHPKGARNYLTIRRLPALI